MWHRFVSMAYGALNRAIFGFANMVWQHPILGAGLLGALLVLAVMMWVEIVREAPASRRLDDRHPIRLQR